MRFGDEEREGRRMKAKRSRRELGAQKGEKNEMEREDGREDDLNANAEWNSARGGEVRAGGKEKIIAW
jgi:hypothetical protein